MIKRRMSQNSPKPINIKRLITWIEVEIGLSKQKATEYIDIAASSLGLVSDNDHTMLFFEAPNEKPI